MKKTLEPRSEAEIAGLDRRSEEPHNPEELPLWSRDFRSRAERDRDRILYSSAFQRLAYVTQVTAPEAGHVFHNRLNHSLKVAQAGRRNAQRLRALVEEGAITGAAGETVLSIHPEAVAASCLAHDLGHPPFGHIAEDVLNRLSRPHTQERVGFEGNAQSFRIVTRLAQRATGSGLNLTRQTLDGMLKYPWRYREQDRLPPSLRERKWGYYPEDREAFEFARANSHGEDSDNALPAQCLEALIMEWADDLTYAVHDVDDFFRAGLIPLHRLGDKDDDEFKHLKDLLDSAKEADIKAWPALEQQEILDTIEEVAGRYAPSGAYRHTRDHRREMRSFGAELIRRYMGAFRVVDNPTEGTIAVEVPDEIEREVEALKLLVRVYVIRRPGLAIVQHGQQRIITDLFDAYYKASESGKDGDRRIFPPEARRTLTSEPDDDAHRARMVVDLIAGLTEDAAVKLHARLFGDGPATTLDAIADMA
jgi:dGTPase